MNPAILVIEDEPVFARNLRVFLEREGLEVAVAPSGESGLQVLAEAPPQVVLLDYNLPGIDGLQVLARIVARAPRVRVIMMTGHGSEDVAVKALKGGAADYLKKPIELAALRLVVHRVLARRRHDDQPLGLRSVDGRRVMDILERRRTSDAPAAWPAALPVASTAALPAPAMPAEKAAAAKTASPAAAPVPRSLAAMVGESAPMLRLRLLVGKVIEADLQRTCADSPAVLVTGESGTGKELVARALHAEGPCKAGPFIVVNCAGIPASLLESALFGYEKGAFADAPDARIGLIESAAGGTLFLDEIGDLEPAAQARLLNVLEEKTVRRLGSSVSRAVEVRFIVGSSRDLERKLRDGEFRADLYYRLRMICIHVPPLRERQGDVLRLAEHFVGVYAPLCGKPGIRLGAEAVAALNARPWPGNVRELQNIIEQAVVLAEDALISVSDLCMQPQVVAPSHSRPDEREMLVAALREAGLNITEAARLLGVSRETLRYRVKKYDIAY